MMRLTLVGTIVSFLGSAASGLAQETLVRLNVVKGAPFSAQAITQTTQQLADGNRIVHDTTAAIARDSEGRTRREQSRTETERLAVVPEISAIVVIQDPAAGMVYVLDGNARSVREIAIPDDKTPQVPAETPNGVKARSRDAISESLGPRMIEGIHAEGSRITRTIPAGHSDNEQPLTIVMETWYAPELQTILLKRTLDPRLGETIYKLINIERSEPPHSLFQVPHEYVIRKQ